MSIWKRFPGEGFPSLITTNVADRQPLFHDPRNARSLLDIVNQARSETGARLSAFVLMPDHLHLVILADHTPMPRIMQLIKGRFARTYNGESRCGPVWQSRYHDIALRSEKALHEAIQYVHFNPVTANLCGSPASYKWSSANPEYERFIDTFWSG